MQLEHLLVLLLALSLTACTTPAPDDDDDDSVAADDDDDDAVSIPDPGDEDLQGVWLASGMDIGSPEMAFQAGVVPTSPGYIEADTDDSGNAFYVFRAGDTFDISISLFGGDDVEWIHMHDGDGLLFGDELTPVSVDLQPGSANGVWGVEEGGVYVFEVHLAGAGFF